MRLCVQNEQDNPDHPREEVRADFRYVRRTVRPGVVGFQEIGELEDSVDLATVYGSPYRIFGGHQRPPKATSATSRRRGFVAVDPPIAHQLKTAGGPLAGGVATPIVLGPRFHVEHMEWRHVPGSARAKVSPTRGTLGLVVRLKDRPKLAPFAILNGHRISGGFSKPGQPGDEDVDHDGHSFRQEVWLTHQALDESWLNELANQGLSTFYLADYNKLDVDPMGGRWLVEHGIDKIGFRPATHGAGRLRFEVHAHGTVSTAHLFTDHAAAWVHGRLDRACAPL